METNQNPVQEQSAQYITPENTQAEQQPVPSPEQPTGQLAPKPEPQPEQPTEKLYNPAEAAQIVNCLTDGYFAPEYILLFGKLVGGTRHSDAMAYDLLMVVRETPEYDWMRAKRLLRYRMPVKHRDIAYINLYIMTLNYVESNKLQRSLPFPPPETPDQLCRSLCGRQISVRYVPDAGQRIDRTGAGRLQREPQYASGGFVHGAGYGLLLSYALLCLSRAGVRYSRSGRDARTDADALDAADAGFRR